jgi:predicted HD phosphohydrolase
MTNFENPVKRHEYIRQPFNQDEYGIKIKIFDDSSYFVYWN